MGEQHKHTISAILLGARRLQASAPFAHANSLHLDYAEDLAIPLTYFIDFLWI